MAKRTKVEFGDDTRDAILESDLQEFDSVIGCSNAFMSNDCPMFWGLCENTLVYLAEKDYRIKNIEAYYGVKLTKEVNGKITVIELVQWLRVNRTKPIQKDYVRINWLGIKVAEYSPEHSLVTLHEIYEHTISLLKYLEESKELDSKRIGEIQIKIKLNNSELFSADGYKIEMYDGRFFHFDSFDKVNDWILSEAKRFLIN